MTRPHEVHPGASSRATSWWAVTLFKHLAGKRRDSELRIADQEGYPTGIDRDWPMKSKEGHCPIGLHSGGLNQKWRVGSWGLVYPSPPGT